LIPADLNAQRSAGFCSICATCSSSSRRMPNNGSRPSPCLTPAERHQLLAEWNDSSRRYRAERSIHELFAEQAGSKPDAVAVVDEGEELTYGELNRRANQLAHYLIERGVRAEVPVGICVDRSIVMVVAVLGTMKAGGSYLPLDSLLSERTIGAAIDDSQAPVLLTQKSLVNMLPGCKAQLVCLDTEWEVIARQGTNNPQVTVAPENAALHYLYSGSTGKPKGVPVTHSNVARLFAALSRGSILTSEMCGRCSFLRIRLFGLGTLGGVTLRRAARHCALPYQSHAGSLL